MNSMVIFHSKMVIVQRFIPVDHAIFGNMWLDMFQKNMEHMMGQPKKNGDFALLYMYTLFLNGTYLVTSKKKTWSYVIYIYMIIYVYIYILMMFSFSHILLLFHPRNPWNQWFPWQNAPPPTRFESSRHPQCSFSTSWKADEALDLSHDCYG